MNKSNLFKSQPARSEIMASMTYALAIDEMNKIKTFAGTKVKEISTITATTQQMAEYYEVPVESIENALAQNAKEFSEDWLIAAMGLKDILFKTRMGRNLMMLTTEGKLAHLQENQWIDLIPKKRSLVYFIHDTKNKLIKIGFSTSVDARFTNFQVGNANILNLLGVCDGGRTEEHSFHKRFIEYKVRSEWFKDCKEIRDCIASLPPLDEQENESFWTPRAALRLGLLLKDSIIADQLKILLIESKNNVNASTTNPKSKCPFSINNNMKNNTLVQTFTFESKNVRVIEIDGDPWFVLSDVLTAIVSSTNVSDASKVIKEGLGDEFVTNYPIPDRLGRLQETTIIHEAGVTTLISRSRTEMGRAFNRHLHAVILPTIRKTGKFVAHPEIEPTDTSITDQLTEINYKLDLLLNAAKTKQSTPAIKATQTELDLDIIQRFNDSKAALLAAKTIENEAKAKTLQQKFAPKPKPDIAQLIATNSVAAWANERVVLDPTAKTYVGKADGNAETHLYPNYVSYCKQHRLELINMQIFSRALMSLVEMALDMKLGKGKDSKGCHVKGIAIGESVNLLMAG